MRTLNVTSIEGSKSGNTVIEVSPETSMGNRLVYKVATAATDVTYDEDLSAWKDIANGEEITATKGQYITVAEVDAENKAKRAGNAVIVCK